MKRYLWFLFFHLPIALWGNEIPYHSLRIQNFQKLYSSEAEEIAREAVSRCRKQALHSTGVYVSGNEGSSEIESVLTMMNTFEEEGSLTLKIQLRQGVPFPSTTALKEEIHFQVPIDSYLRLFEGTQNQEELRWDLGYHRYLATSRISKSGTYVSIFAESEWGENQLNSQVRKEVQFLLKNGEFHQLSLRIWNFQEPATLLGFNQPFQEIFYGQVSELTREFSGILLFDEDEELGVLTDLEQIKRAADNKTPWNFHEVISDERLYQSAWNQCKQLVINTN